MDPTDANDADDMRRRYTMESRQVRRARMRKEAFAALRKSNEIWPRFGVRNLARLCVKSPKLWGVYVSDKHD
jgi:hypothetical protein